MRNPFRFPTNLPTYFTARFDAAESSRTTRSLVSIAALSHISVPNGMQCDYLRFREGGGVRPVYNAA